MITLYSTGCPRCSILEEKISAKNIEVTICTDEKEMEKRGIEYVPALQLDNEEILDFKAAVDWVNNYVEAIK